MTRLQADDCGEDKFPPFFKNGDCRATLANTWIANASDAKGVLCGILKPRVCMPRRSAWGAG